jgi:hypothetical protein
MSELGPIPTPAEIEACTDFIVNNDDEDRHNRNLKIVKIGNYAIKYGGRTKLLEAENLLFLAENCTARVPKCYGYGHLPESKKPYIIMNFIEGATAEVLYPTLDKVDQAEIVRQIAEQVAIWRSMPDPGYIGSIGKRPLEDWFWREQPLNSRPSDRFHRGPFENHHEFADCIILHTNARSDPEVRERIAPGVKLWNFCLHEALKDSRTTWSHCDLMPKNIMVNKEGTNEDGSGIWTVTVIDWENGGWYPEWWEWADHENFQGRPLKWWCEIMPAIIPVYAKEMFMWRVFEEITWPIW